VVGIKGRNKMNALRNNRIGRTVRWALLGLAATALVISAPAAFGDVLTTPVVTVLPTMPTGCWKLTITADAAAKAAGRDDFFEYVYFQGTTFDGQEIARLGFDPGPITGGVNAAGQTTFSVTLKSNSQGTVVASGLYLVTTMSGTLTWTRPDGKVYTYNFTGLPYTPDPNVES
jgi:hypothetical protein